MAEDFSAEFIAQLKQDQPLAWRLAFQALYPIAWHGAGHARWRLSEQDREEVASEALAEVARQLAGLATWREISALTFVIARRRSISRLRALLAQKRGARVPRSRNSGPLRLEGVRRDLGEMTSFLWITLLTTTPEA